ncbi:hypothetical protein Fot_11059 [Forsythia ovata]|uniref:Uncharacterized protein n=1 Tax=Forsythia ovata TaxID=205694 RepID=A0ABD1WIN0_9LAMI
MDKDELAKDATMWTTSFVVQVIKLLVPHMSCNEETISSKIEAFEAHKKSNIKVLNNLHRITFQHGNMQAILTCQLEALADPYCLGIFNQELPFPPLIAGN